MVTNYIFDNEAAAGKWHIDPQQGERFLKKIQAHPEFLKALVSAFGQQDFQPVHDPDLMLYSGGFFSEADRSRMQQVRRASPQQLGMLDLPFEDRRLPEMLFRYRARNFPETLSNEERARWEEYRRYRLSDPDAGGSITEAAFEKRIKELRCNVDLTSDQISILDELEKYQSQLR